jgi:flavin-dependent dehydrogenase
MDQTNIPKFDIIIVGAGPGGSIAAQVAASQGFSVLLLEEQALLNQGRYKACGGALAWEVVEELKYPLDKIERIIESLELLILTARLFQRKAKGQ